MTKTLSGGVSVLDYRKGRQSGTVKLNYLNRNSEKTILSNPVISMKKGQFSSRAGNNPKLIFSDLKDNIPTQKWIPDSMNILREFQPVFNATELQTNEPYTPVITPILPKMGKPIPVAQGLSVATNTDGLLRPRDPRPMVDAGIQMSPVQKMEPMEGMQQIINNNYFQQQIVPVSNQYTSNQQFVNNDNTVNNQFVNVDNSQTQNNQYVDQTQLQINNTLVQQEFQHLVNNQLQLQIQNENILNYLAIQNNNSLVQPYQIPGAYESGMQQITLDKQAMGDGSGLAIEYPMTSLDTVNRPDRVYEPEDSLVNASFENQNLQPTPVVVQIKPNKSGKKNRRKENRLKRIENLTNPTTKKYYKNKLEQG